MIVLGLDPGFRHIGLCVCSVDKDLRVEVLALRHISTVGDSERYKTESNLSDAREIFEAIDQSVRVWDPEIIVSEAMSWPQNQNTVAMLGMFWGVLAAITALYRLPTLHVPPMDLKAAVTGKRTASKEEVANGVAAVTKRAGELVAEAGWNKTDAAHPIDAVGAVMAGVKTDDFLLFWSRK